MPEKIAGKVAGRFIWAVETLGVEPDEHLLEIGCGHGVAVSLVCEQLVGGSITAIDQSKAMIELAKRRNQQYISAGKAKFQTTALAQADFGDERFNKIFAFSVNVFWKQPTRELEIIRNVLMPGGALYLFYQPPIASKTRAVAGEITRILQSHDFVIKDLLFKELKPAQAVCVIAEAPSLKV